MRIVQGMQQIGLVDSRGYLKGNPKDTDVSGGAAGSGGKQQEAGRQAGSINQRGTSSSASLQAGSISASPPSLPSSLATSRCPPPTPHRMLPPSLPHPLLPLPPPHPTPVQNPKSAAYKWTSKLQKLLPWLASDSTTLSLTFRNSLIQQSLLVAYAKHEHVGGKLHSPAAELRTALPLGQIASPVAPLALASVPQPRSSCPGQPQALPRRHFSDVSSTTPAPCPPLPPSAASSAADYMMVCLKWLQSDGKANLDALLKKYTVKNLAALTAERIYGDDDPVVVDPSAPMPPFPPSPPSPPPPPPPRWVWGSISTCGLGWAATCRPCGPNPSNMCCQWPALLGPSQPPANQPNLAPAAAAACCCRPSPRPPPGPPPPPPFTCMDRQCTNCTGDDYVCRACTPGWGLDVEGGEGSSCLPCQAQRCVACSPDASKCFACIKGFGWDKASASCLPCQEGCTACASDAGRCWGCSAGYDLKDFQCLK